jgi:hypothetical protein
MPEHKIDAETPPSCEAVEASAESEHEADPPSMPDGRMREKDAQERDGEFELAGRLVWRRQSAALVDLGVCASWCALVSRGPSASISRFGLRTSGSATWVFVRPRCADVGCAAKPDTACSKYSRHSRR